MLEVYNIQHHGNYDIHVIPELFNVMNKERTRGHLPKLTKNESRLELHKIFFTRSVVNV